jgi:hypothetical protein
VQNVGIGSIIHLTMSLIDRCNRITAMHKCLAENKIFAFISALSYSSTMMIMAIFTIVCTLWDSVIAPLKSRIRHISSVTTNEITPEYTVVKRNKLVTHTQSGNTV